jgi:UDP-N-acetylglucosamine--dolichyl-phosphate N-acetylglucosaminephosphotransferase
MEFDIILRVVVIAILFAFGITEILLPELIRKMRKSGMVSPDVNKPYPRKIPNLGGLAALFGFSIALTIVVGIEKLIGYVSELPFLAVISVFFIAAMIGLVDDIVDISDRMKVIGLLFASMPLTVTHHAIMIIDLPFGMVLDVTEYYWLFWLVLVPIGVTCAANALNMSAGYNGLESGQVIIITFFLLVITALQGNSIEAVTVFAALLGCSIALYRYNKYPAKVFVGNIGSMGIGAAIASGVIIGAVEFYAIICILPAFYEAGATFYYKYIHPVDRRKLVHDLEFSKDGKLKPPKGAEYFTLPMNLLSREPMTERFLVERILSLYLICGIIALFLSIL